MSTSTAVAFRARGLTKTYGSGAASVAALRGVGLDLFDSESVGDGYRVEIRVVVWERDDVIKIPISSLFRDGDQWRVFVAERGTAVSRAVEVGERNALEAEVRRGLTAGERVIVHPPDEIESGVSVVPRS